MKKLRRILAAFLSICICVSFFSIVSASPAVTTSDKAAVLNTLSILQGDSGNYRLNDPLKRSEAAAFIVRLMGKEEYVIQDSETLGSTRFSDVPDTEWFAPYVGYCTEQGIIASDNDKFKPKENISEKGFLKIVLGALGYKEGTDFLWNTVYAKAYEAGLVTDKAYLQKTADNLQYTRAEVVGVLYNALTKENKDTGITLLQNLINEGIVSREEAISTGLVSGEDSPAGIEQILILNQNSIFIKFNKAVQDIRAEDIKIYETGDFTKKLEVSIQAKQPDSIVIKTSNQEAYRDYTFELNNVKGIGSALSGTLSGTFTGYKATELKSDFFRISKIEPVSMNAVNVYFTHPVNSNSEIASYYEILDKDGNSFVKGSTRNLVAKFASSPDNMATINLQGVSFKDGEQYTLKVSGDLSSIYGVKLNEGEGDSIRFKVTGLTGSSTSNSDFKIVQISLLDYKTIQIEFNMEVHPTRAQQISSFYITDPNGNYIAINKAAVGGEGAKNGKIIYLSINSAFIKTNNYKMFINEIDDISKQYSIIEKEYTFSGAYPERTVLNIQSVTALDKNTVSVSFDRPLDETAALTKEYYSISGVSHLGFYSAPAKIMYDPDTNPNLVKLYLPPDKELISGKTYKLTVLSIMKDNLGNVAGVNREATFYGSGTTGAKPVISDAVIISKDTVKITTSRDIALDKPNILASNYTLEYDDNGTTISKVPRIIGYINSTTLVLLFDTLDFEKEYTLKFKLLKDYSELYTRTAADGQNFIKVRLGK